MIRYFGTEREFFGSDLPWVDPDKDADRLLNLKLSDTELEMVSLMNAAALFEI